MADSPHPFSVHRVALRTARALMVEDVLWLVYELPPLPFDRRTTNSLIFESDFAIRRVRNFPVEWRLLSDEQLFALSWSV